MTVPDGSVPCPRTCRCSVCGELIAKGDPARPAGEMGMGRDKVRCWDHPDCWRREFAGI